MNRREFLKFVGAVAAAVLLPACKKDEDLAGSKFVGVDPVSAEEEWWTAWLSAEDVEKVEF